MSAPIPSPGIHTGTLSPLPTLPPRQVVVDALVGLAQTGTPGRGAAPLFDIGTDRFLRHFDEEVLGTLVATGGATCRFFEGAYGAGKTHLLSLLQARAAARGMCVVRTDLSQALSLEDWQAITQHVLEKIELVIGGRVVTSLPRILEALAGAGAANVAGLSRVHLPHAGFARAMRQLAAGEVGGAAARRLIGDFLSGEPVALYRLNAVGVTGIRGPLTRRNAEHVLRTVLNGLHALGVPGTMLLFDEAERVFQVPRGEPSKRVRSAANLMRRFIDACVTGSVSGTVAVFAVLPRFVDSCALAYDALGQRLAVSRVGDGIAWRWPVVPVDRLSTAPNADAFLTAAVERFSNFVDHCGGTATAARSDLTMHGAAVLERNAGSGYRRELTKVLATVSLQYIERGAHS